MTIEQITAAIEANEYPENFTADEKRTIAELWDNGHTRGAQRKFQETMDKKVKPKRTLL